MQTLPGNTEQAYSFGEFTAERVNPANLRDAYILHQAVYSSPVPKMYYHKKYNTAYTGIINTAFIAYNKDRVAVAYYGVVPCYLQCGNTFVRSGQSVDTMTHPDYRKQGLLTELHNLVVQLSRNEGIKILFGFGNQDSIPIYKHKYHWEECGIVDRFEIPVAVHPVTLFLKNNAVLKYLFKGYRKGLLQKHKLPDAGVDNQDVKNGYWGVCRSTQYLGHKKYNDTMVVRINGAKAWIKAGASLMVGDVDLNGCTLENVLDGLKKLARQLGVQTIHLAASRPSYLYTLLAAHYTPIPAFPVLYKDLGAGLDLENIRFTFADIDVF